MNRSELELQLKGCKPSEKTPISPLVRSRLDQTYESLAEINIQKESTALQRVRRAAVLTAAAAFLGIAIVASGFMSPVMAASVKQIPWVGSIFSSIEADLGLKSAGMQGLTSNVNSSTAFQDVKFNVTETVFDGTRAAFAINISAPNLKNGQYDTGKSKVRLSDAVDSVFVEIGGKKSNEPDAPVNGVSYWSAGEQNPNLLIMEMTAPSGPNSLPETFDAALYIRLAGIDHEFKLDIPVQQSSKDVVDVVPNQSKSNDGMTFSLSDVSVTPVTTRLKYSVSIDSHQALDEKTARKLRYTRVAVFDDQGNLLSGLSGEGMIEGNQMTYDYRYASTGTRPKYLILKPFVQEDGDFPEKIQSKQFIKGLEMKVELPSQN